MDSTVWADRVGLSYQYPFIDSIYFVVCVHILNCVLCVHILDSCSETETKGTTNQRAQICTSGPPKFTDCPSKTSSQGGTSDAQILTIDIFALACPVIFYCQWKNTRANVGALRLEQCVFGMTSGQQLTLERLRRPLERERDQLREAREAILQQLKVLKVSRKMQLNVE